MASWKWNEMLEHCYQPHVNSGHSVFVSCDLFTDFRSNDRLELLSYYSTASWSAVKGATARAENFILIFDRMIGWNYCYQLRVNLITQQHPEVPSKAQQRWLELKNFIQIIYVIFICSSISIPPESRRWIRIIYVISIFLLNLYPARDTAVIISDWNLDIDLICKLNLRIDLAWHIVRTRTWNI